MKDLIDCKEYYKDAHTTWLAYRDKLSETRLDSLKEAICFIYGKEVNATLNRWTQESLKEFYG